MSDRSTIIKLINQVLSGSKKISELDEITSTTTNDYLEIVQAGENYKIKKGNLVTGGGGGGVNSVSGTTDRITISGTASDPIVDIASTYAGQNTITTLGTITTGTWNGTTISVARGGTGATTITGVLVGNGTSPVTATAIAQGDLFYGSAVNTLAALAKDTNSTRYLSNTGTSNNPAWAQVNLTNGVTGVLPVANGGTGSATAIWWALSGTSTVTTPTITGKVTWTQAAESSTNTFHTFTQASHTGGTPVGILFTGGAHTTLTSATESNDIHFNLNRTVQFNSGVTLALQRAVNISAPEYSSTAATTITHAATLSLRTPTAGTNMTITNASALLVTDGSTNAQIALNPPNVNFGAIVFGSSSKASTGSIGPASKSTGSFQASGTAVRFHADMTAATVGAFQFTTFSTTTPLNSGASIFINASPAYTQSTSVGASHSVFRTGFTFTHAGTTGNRITAFLADPTFNITNTNASTIEGFAYTPVQTALNSNSVNKAWVHNSGIIQWESILSPAQITSNQNDYNPTGLNSGGAPNGATIVRLSTDASRDITSIVGGVSGRLLILANVGSQNIVLKDDDGATGTAANRLQLNADITLLPEQSIMLWYDGTSSRWRSIV